LPEDLKAIAKELIDDRDGYNPERYVVENAATTTSSYETVDNSWEATRYY